MRAAKNVLTGPDDPARCLAVKLMQTPNRRHRVLCLLSAVEGICCTNPLRDSPCEFSVVAAVNVQTEAPHLQHYELA